MRLDRLLSDSRVNNRRLKDAMTARVYQIRIYANENVLPELGQNLRPNYL